MPQRSEESVQIFEGDALLTRRTESPYWQLKFRMGRRFVRVSTKENSLKKAKKFSTKFYSRALLKHEDGQPLVSRRFRSVAKAVRDRFQRGLLTQDEPVFALPDGTVTKALDKVFTRMLKDFGILHDKFGQTRSLYSLRHFCITHLLFRNKVSPAVVAYQCGTSIQMIQKHYFHGEHDYHAEALSS